VQAHLFIIVHQKSAKHFRLTNHLGVETGILNRPAFCVRGSANFIHTELPVVRGTAVAMYRQISKVTLL
jgi:hypothetical protein